MSNLIYDLFNGLMWLLIDEEGRSVAQIAFCFVVIGGLLVLLKLKDDE